MTPMQYRMVQEKLQREMRNKAMIGNALDAGTAALSYADDLVTPAARQAQLALLKASGGVGAGAGTIGSRMAGALLTPKALNVLKLGAGASALGGVLGAADVVAGNDGLANKTMDTAAMGIGGFLGAAGGPLGMAAGAGIGKALSDGTQFLLGGGKSAEQRRMEEALAQLQGRGMV